MIPNYPPELKEKQAKQQDRTPLEWHYNRFKLPDEKAEYEQMVTDILSLKNLQHIDTVQQLGSSDSGTLFLHIFWAVTAKTGNKYGPYSSSST